MDPLIGMTLTLFPTSDHRELALSAYGLQSAPSFMDSAAVGDFVPPSGLDLSMRRVFDTEDALNDDGRATGTSTRVRFYRDAAGELHVDELSIENPVFLLRQRPTLGDNFDLGLLTGRWDEVWAFGNTERLQWRIWSPMQVTLMGLSVNDMDDSGQLKYYIAGGTGFGAEVLARTLGPVGVQARVDAGTTSTNRMREGKNATRHELELNAELGLGLLFEKQAWMLGAWANHVTQWDPRDAEGRDGVDRQYIAGGLRLSGRFYEEKEVELAPSVDLEELLRTLSTQRENEERTSLFERPDADPTPQSENLSKRPDTPDTAPGVLEVHWSEVEILSGKAPELSAAPAESALCELRIDIGPTGSPYAIEPLTCPDELRAPVMAAAWTWQFTPIQHDGDTVPARFVLPWTPAMSFPAAAPR